MVADQNFYDICFTFFYPTASATAYDQRPKFLMAEHSATAEGENWTYGPTLVVTYILKNLAFIRLYICMTVYLHASSKEIF